MRRNIWRKDAQSAKIPAPLDSRFAIAAKILAKSPRFYADNFKARPSAINLRLKQRFNTLAEGQSSTCRPFVPISARNKRRLTIKSYRN